MNLRQEDLYSLSKSTGFKNSDMLEKVVQLISLLNEIFDNNYLKSRLVLKRGTALNLFYFNLPRLSVDIDFNYIGSIDRNIMLEERKELEDILMRLCQRSGFTIKRVAKEHAGGKWRLNYASAIKAGGNIEIDLSFLYRATFFPVITKDSILIGLGATCEEIQRKIKITCCNKIDQYFLIKTREIHSNVMGFMLFYQVG